MEYAEFEVEYKRVYEAMLSGRRDRDLTADAARLAALAATARFCLVTLAGRTEAPALAIVRELMQEWMRD